MALLGALSLLALSSAAAALPTLPGRVQNAVDTYSQIFSTVGIVPDVVPYFYGTPLRVTYPTLDAPLHVALAVLGSPLRRLRVVLDDDHAPLFAGFLEALVLSNAPLQSLQVHAVPDFLAAETLRVLGASVLATTLRHVGVLALPVQDVRLSSSSLRSPAH